MKKVLYLTNIEVPYRVRFFNELAKKCDLTVVYERRKSKNRDEKWASGEQRGFRSVFLGGIRISNENGFSLGILRYVLKKYDAIVVGCYNSPVQMMAIMVMRLLRIPYYINIDGEAFLDGTGLKSRLKRFMIRGARKYLAAGERSAAALKKVVGDKPVIPYYFSSLDETELQVNGAEAFRQRSEAVLIVGQYMDYKGLDVALRVAQMDPKRTYKFVGMGNRTELFVREHQPDKLDNVQIIPFLQKDYLQQEYRSCAAMLLPSRRECWGLVVNEAASFGMPIVSTWGSGAAVEFLSQEYPQYLAEPGNEFDLNNKLQALLEDDNIEEYQSFLLEKSKQYSIERCVLAHLNAFDIH